MERTITAVTLGRSLRSQANIRTRQPLRSAILVSINSEVREDLNTMKEIFVEELNVKNVGVEEGEEKLVTLTAKANFRSLGPRLGKNMKEVATKVSNFGYPEINSLRQGKSINVSYGENLQIEISLEDIEIRRQEKPGIAAANEGDITVALDLTLDEELEQEGLAREIVNRIQNLRKETGLEVTDRITITYSVPDPVNQAILKHSDYITKETLAKKITAASNIQGGELIKILEYECQFLIEKVG